MITENTRRLSSASPRPQSTGPAFDNAETGDLSATTNRSTHAPTPIGGKQREAQSVGRQGVAVAAATTTGEERKGTPRHAPSEEREEMGLEEGLGSASEELGVEE